MLHIDNALKIKVFYNVCNVLDYVFLRIKNLDRLFDFWRYFCKTTIRCLDFLKLLICLINSLRLIYYDNFVSL